jgi:hypothetical protein
MGQGRRVGRPAGVAKAGGAVAGQEDDEVSLFSFFFFLFNYADKWALLSMSASLFFLYQLIA